MKNKIWSLTFISLLVLGCTSNISNSKFKALTAKSSELKGQIISLKVKQYSALQKNGKIEKAHEAGRKEIEFQKFFDKNNNLKRTDFYFNGSLQSSTKIKLDKSNGLQCLEIFDENNKLVQVDEVIESTQNSYVIKNNHLLYKAPSIIIKECYKKGLMTSKTSHINDSIVTEWIFLRDATNKVMQTNIINDIGGKKDTTIFIAKYLEQDHHGNWTKKIDFNKEQPENINVYERIIEYRNE